MDLKEETILGERIHDHWYYVSKGRAMRDFLGSIHVPEVLDVGAGSGIFSKQLLKAGISDSAVCVDPNYAEEKSTTYDGKPVRFIREQDKTTQNLVLIMDVLEHVEDDLALLKSYVDSMEVGGKVFITVPAFQFLWSGHDVFLEHYRRYTIAMIESLVLRAGLTPVRSRYFFGSLFPIISLFRILQNIIVRTNKTKPKSDLKKHGTLVNSILLGVHEAERATLFKFNRLFGLSVFCLCEKRNK